MCGIAGVFHHAKDNSIDPQLLVNMAAIQYHRGPDDFGYVNPEGLGMGMSHARLSIIDLNKERGRQPHLSSNKDYFLVHNGEFYDFQKIRAELTSLGDRFKSKSDSEIILHLFPRYGIEKTIEFLRGEFAFALYDKKDDCLYLVRDRFGVKPLYWTETEDGIVYGSELKVLFAHPKVRRELTAQGTYHQLIQVMVPGTTAFKGIHQVKPGHIIKIKRIDGRLSVSEQKYWDIDFPVAGEYVDHKDESYYIEGVRDQLLEAVQHRLQADVPVGCYLSGGIDSCSILGLSAAVRQDPVKAFTIGFDSDEYDETPIATEMAQMTGADQIVLKLNAEQLYNNFSRTIWHTERTIYNTLAVAKLLMSETVRNNQYKVVLTGEGSDELFAGYPAFRKDMFLYGLDDLPSSLRAEWQSSLEASNSLFKGAMLPREEFSSAAMNEVIGFTPTCLQSWLHCHSYGMQLLNPEWRQDMASYDAGSAIANTFDRSQLEGRHPLDKAQYVWIKTMLEGQILTWGGDRVDMANSMEARPAFLDHHLAKFATQVPPQLRIKGATEKYVLREAMKGLLPESLYKRQKFAFMAPPAHTDQNKWNMMMALMDEFASKEKVEAAGALDYQAVNALIKSHEDPDMNRDQKVQLDAVLNHVLGIQLLHQHFIANDIPAVAEQRARELGWNVHNK
ncbi:asparagine synthase (glutamine-hydrolyzing) [Pleionea sp. CnH1-48]|uniref:asparagine synthase (glutamine-hydrolyzing) n=1 Tax=Pleionea sp. CnH1-48 TaxID=2954494 RepID=UPI002096942A|nr:asparagine synthase (glutamine-hydrolyzing) [Pleionea sp. CnH1-48]MCO7224381.1 asparagine synthase (glutamine-hydrolyzing) [Pleionea sp. CnH1-48]